SLMKKKMFLHHPFIKRIIQLVRNIIKSQQKSLQKWKNKREKEVAIVVTSFALQWKWRYSFSEPFSFLSPPLPSSCDCPSPSSSCLFSCFSSTFDNIFFIFA